MAEWKGFRVRQLCGALQWEGRLIHNPNSRQAPEIIDRKSVNSALGLTSMHLNNHKHLIIFKYRLPSPIWVRVRQWAF